MKKKFRINIITLGCSKNLVDSEVLMKQLDVNHIEVTHNDEIVEADAILINTCGFINDAKEESVNTILECIEAKNNGYVKAIYVFGCLSQRYREELQNEMPEVDGFFGVDSFKAILEKLSATFRTDLVGERVITTPGHYAYLKIAEGCNWGCSYCAIPLIRGKYISVSIERLVKDTTRLVEQGVKEIMLIAQDLTYYGVDLYGERKLADLLEALAKIEGLKWIRLHYAYPTMFPKEVVDVMKRYNNICKYLDIPIQHSSTEVLKSMRRGITREETKELLDYIKSEIPDIALRTTIMVGHPGESQKEFDDLKDFVKDIKFDRLGVFTYSEEEGTWGADNLSDDISQEVKQERADEIMEIQQDISYNLNQQRVGKEYEIIIDRREGDYLIGRSEFDSPEIDNEILINTDIDINPGEFVNVKILRADDFDLYAEMI
ncbi:MAG: 30S ribosomal protein S12 methylthiotransferase RimO [Bacteroidales bacterium]|jgi:ribosomal protein S12 methylthiotransferase|nr:30S ribosomal protein S12 methylthiotransferase RimO [Bacteroidales bacterium]